MLQKGYPKLNEMNKFHEENCCDLEVNMYDWVSNNRMLFLQAILESNKVELITLMRATKKWLTSDSP